MGILDTFKNKAIDAGFLEPDKPKTGVTKASPVAVPSNTLPIPAVVVGGVGPDPEIIDALNKAIAGSTRQEYNQFKVIFETLNTIPDATRYDMALKLFTATNKANPSTVLTAVDERIKLLEREQTDFEASYQAEMQQSVVGKQADVRKITEQEEALKTQLRELSEKRVQTMQEAGDAQVKLERDRAAFNASYDVVRSSLDTERQRIATFIPVVK